jgi:hypothetical protein
MRATTSDYREKPHPPAPERTVRYIALALLLIVTAGCATVRRDVPVVLSTAWDRPAETALGREYLRELAAYPGHSGFYVLDDGREAFLARAALAENAERTLDLQYYLVGEDATADILLLRLIRAAQRGVRVAAGSEDGLGERTHRLHDRQICPPALVSHAVFDGRDVGDDELLYPCWMGQRGGHHHFAAE